MAANAATVPKKDLEAASAALLKCLSSKTGPEVTSLLSDPAQLGAVYSAEVQEGQGGGSMWMWPPFKQVHDYMLKEQILVHKVSSVPVVSLMAAVIDVDAVSDEAAAMRHLEASNPAILAVIGGEMRTPRTFATYKLLKHNPCLVYARSDIDLVSVPTTSIYIEAKFFRVGLKADPKTAREADSDAPIVGFVRMLPKADKNAFRTFMEQNARHFQRLYPNSPLVAVGDLHITSEQDVERLSAVPGLNFRSFVAGGTTAVSFLRSPSAASISVKQVPESGGLTLRMRTHRCKSCKLSFSGAAEAAAHKASNRHRIGWLSNLYHNNRSDLSASKLGMRFLLAPELLEDGAVALDEAAGSLRVTRNAGEEEREIKILLRNDDEERRNVLLSKIEFITENSGFEISDKYDITKPIDQRKEDLKQGVRLLPGRSLTLKVTVPKKYETGTYYAPMVACFRLHKKESPWQFMLLEVLLKVATPLTRALAPVEPYQRPEPLQSFRGSNKVIVPGIRPESNKKAAPKKIRLSEYHMSKEVREAFYSGVGKEENPLVKALDTEELTRDNYAKRLQLLLWAEEHQMEVDIRNYDMHEVVMAPEGKFLYLKVPGLSENRPSVLRGDKLLVAMSSNPDTTYEGFVHDVEETRVKLLFHSKLMTVATKAKIKFDVRFTINRFPQRTFHRAVETLAKDWVALEALFPTKDRLSSGAAKTTAPKNGFVNKNIGTNPEQAAAVCRIISDAEDNAPYIVFGPPGTGKTVTLVEAIVQLYKTRPASTVLACAPSNSAADLLAERLLYTISPSDLHRTYARSRQQSQVPAKLFAVSSFSPQRENLSVTDIASSFRIVVTTVVTAGHLVTYGVPRGHFSHIFVDESGQAHEPEAIIPIAGLAQPGKTKVIMAGDPKQLGPIIRSPVAIRGGLQISLLERLMASDKPGSVFQRDSETGLYDSKYVTKLQRNFRSHGSILSLPSRLFYHGELVNAADPMITGQFLRWEHLPKAGFPMIFHALEGTDMRESRSPSFFNAEECEVVVDYVQKLLSSKIKITGADIGIITPYHRQVVKIKDAINRYVQSKAISAERKKGITVGSTEIFQGQERKVIIVSTVRSQQKFLAHDFRHKLGFLRNPKRFNVAITRAKALLIVVGNPYLLFQDENWRALIEHAHSNGGYTGRAPFPAGHGDPMEDAVADRLESVFGEMNISDGAGAGIEEQISQMELAEAPEWRADF